MPNDMDRAYNAWTGRKTSALRRHTLDCGHAKQEDVFFHLWCDRLSCSTECADAPHDCEQFKGKSSIEEEAVEAEAVVEARGAPVATGDSSPEGRRRFAADVAYFRAALAAGASWPPVEPEVEAAPPRSGITLADMEAASEAVRARRHQIADLFDVPHELVEPGPWSHRRSVDPAAIDEPSWAWTDITEYVRRVDPALPGHMVTLDNSSATCTLFERIEAEGDTPPVDAALEEPDPSTALNRHLAEVGAPLHDGHSALTAEQLGALNNRHRPVPWCVCPPCQERRALPWWRRMLGGTR